MTSTTSKLDWAFIAAKSALLIYAVVLMAIGCASPEQQTTGGGLSHTNRVPALAEPQTPAPQTTAPEPKKEEKEPPYYGSTYWDEFLTSVYYYPSGDQGDVAVTHLKFDHREDDLYLCGDQRKSFEPGNRYKLLVTFEPNQPCVSNWKIK